MRPGRMGRVPGFSALCWRENSYIQEGKSGDKEVEGEAHASSLTRVR